MSCHIAPLPESYIAQLEQMSLLEVAAEAARFRSDVGTPGTATKAILRWVRRRIESPQAYYRFELIYRSFWQAERVARSEGLRVRPESRPVKGIRRPRSMRRLESAHVLV